MSRLRQSNSVRPVYRVRMPPLLLVERVKRGAYYGQLLGSCACILLGSSLRDLSRARCLPYLSPSAPPLSPLVCSAQATGHIPSTTNGSRRSAQNEEDSNRAGSVRAIGSMGVSRQGGTLTQPFAQVPPVGAQTTQAGMYAPLSADLSALIGEIGAQLPSSDTPALGSSWSSFGNSALAPAVDITAAPPHALGHPDTSFAALSATGVDHLIGGTTPVSPSSAIARSNIAPIGAPNAATAGHGEVTQQPSPGNSCEQQTASYSLWRD